MTTTLPQWGEPPLPAHPAHLSLVSLPSDEQVVRDARDTSAPSEASLPPSRPRPPLGDILSSTLAPRRSSYLAGAGAALLLVAAVTLATRYQGRAEPPVVAQPAALTTTTAMDIPAAPTNTFQDFAVPTAAAPTPKARKDAKEAKPPVPRLATPHAPVPASRPTPQQEKKGAGPSGDTPEPPGDPPPLPFDAPLAGLHEPRVVVLERTSGVDERVRTSINVGAGTRGFDPIAARAALDSIQPGPCWASGTHGSGKARVVYGTNGEVELVEITNLVGAPRPDGECIARMYSSAVVPPFAGATVTAIGSFSVN